jgi:hypothetical protein
VVNAMARSSGYSGHLLLLAPLPDDARATFVHSHLQMTRGERVPDRQAMDAP